MIKHIFITGGVISGLGKGLTASSLGMLLKSWGINVRMQKFDPYLNVDPGTMNPLQHGEVFVTYDGGETDLDLGNYERFIDVSLPKLASATTGQVYTTVLNKERNGEYLGDTVQVIPHIVDEIKSRMRSQEQIPDTDGKLPDIIITEIGGTVGDIESQPFLEAARQIRQDVGRNNVFFTHVSLVPLIGASNELKTKPTQHSVMALRSLGISPNALIIRSEIAIDFNIKSKISLFCDVDQNAIVNCTDVPSIYDVPFMIRDSKLDEYIMNYFSLESQYEVITESPYYSKWVTLRDSIKRPIDFVEIAIVGKYTQLHDSYLSVIEALKSAAYNQKLEVKIRWVDAIECESPQSAQNALRGVDGVLIPGGFGYRGVDGKIGALKWSRENKVPTLGICLGLQAMVIEFARNVLGLKDASSTEFDPNTSEPLITTMEQQVELIDSGKLGGTMRLGAYDAGLEESSLAYELYNSTKVSERHRHRYEVNRKYHSALEDSGLKISGKSLGKSDWKNVSTSSESFTELNNNQNALGLAEFVELDRSIHPYYIATQAHPEFKSRPIRPAPLFYGLIKSAFKFKNQRN